MRKPLAAKDYRLMSAAAQLWGLGLIVVLLLAGRPDFAVLLFVGFWIGAACASYGARSNRFNDARQDFSDLEARIKEVQQRNRMDQ